MNEKIKNKLYKIVFEADTRVGKSFDIILLITIFLSVLIVMLESVKSINVRFGESLRIAEWFITGIFTLEYLTRIYIVKKKYNYILSFYGIIDLLSILPLYLGLFVPGSHKLSIIRSFRLLRTFRIFKLSRYVSESKTLIMALKASRQKISVFFI